MDTGSTSRRPLSLCCKGSSEYKADESVTYELLLPSASSIGGGEPGVTMKPLEPRLLLGATGVSAMMEGWSMDPIVRCVVFGRTWLEWAGTGESMRNIRVMIV